MQVPMVVGCLLELVSVAELDVANLSAHIEAMYIQWRPESQARG